jgi:Plasmid pRiA4b ORF-3-like protein.
MKWQNLIFQFKISLQEINPTIWRRIQVPAKYSFWDLHVAIQDSMGWFDCHLHVFRLKKPHGEKIIEIGIPMDDFDDIKILQGWDEYISDYLFEPGIIATYEYDFGDSWNHEIVFEGILLKEKAIKYPCCIDGQRACPPEDCGGAWGYENLLKVIADPDNDEYESTIEWLSGWYGKYDPEAFNRKKIKFDNPEKRWKKAFLEH